MVGCGRRRTDAALVHVKTQCRKFQRGPPHNLTLDWPIITTIAVVTIAHSSEILHLMALNEVRRPRIGNDEHTVLVFTASSCRSSRVSCSHPPLPVSEEPERHAAKRIPNAPPLVFQVSKTSKLPLLCKFMIDPFTSGRWWPGGTLFFC
jgi:hypothetical protein